MATTEAFERMPLTFLSGVRILLPESEMTAIERLRSRFDALDQSQSQIASCSRANPCF
ncbi:hypothetical protein [Acidihalobacter ferrooxydans]|uniref:hypothetical protein n=1 Tax=Acidihalobacter ferrooxydans TaxID=1765967 RepID=UPI0012EB54E9|nr:hypothetical protein [Acidihalobacter ferrooxydans]